MPLPADSILTLQGHSRPGDTIQTKAKKQAMVVRLSEEAFHLLGTYPNQPPMEFEFGDNPGIYVGDSFFHLQPFKENIPHELYLRASSAGKPMAPLKQYATVTGRLTVDRSRDDSVLKSLEDPGPFGPLEKVDAATFRSEQAAKQRKLYTSMFRHPVQPADHVLLTKASVGPSHAPTSTSTSQTSTPREDLIPLRKDLIHSLALNQQQCTDDVVKEFGGPDCSASLRNDILSLLEDVAEQLQLSKKAGETPAKVWRLKTRSWLEVRPYEWPNLTEQIRTSMARTARLAYGDLGVPEKDPAWNHVRYRNSSGAQSAAPSATQTTKNSSSSASRAKPSKVDAIKRGISTKEKATPSKAENPKAKGDVAGRPTVIKAKPVPVNAAGASGIHAVQAETSATPAVALAPRRLPGSGFKSTKSRSDSPAPRASPAANARPTDKNTPTPPARATASTPLPDVAASAPPSAQSIQRIKKVKESSTTSNTDKDRRLDKAKGKSKDRPQGGGPELDRTKGQKDEEDLSSIGLKRKTIRDTDDGGLPPSSIQKRRRTEHDHTPSTSNKSDHRPKDLSLPQKPQTGAPPRPKPKRTKKEPSPPQQAKQDPPPRPAPRPKIKDPSPPPPAVTRPPMHTHKKAASGSSSASTHNHPESSIDRAKSNGKVRRKSPIYTSSEDEEAAPLSKIAKRDATSTSASASRPSSHTPKSQTLTRPTSLRERYRDRYTVYIATFQRLNTQKRKMELLQQKCIELGLDEIWDSDDPDLLGEEETQQLMADYVAIEQEMKQMIDEHARQTRVAA